jgi:hypothetical protein
MKAANFSIQKGKRGEREVVKLLQPIIDRVYSSRGIEAPQLERNLMQSHKGGYDLVGMDWLALEVKYQENEQLDKWWEQTLRQAGIDQQPILIYRKAHAKWRVAMMVTIAPGVQVRGIISVDDFLRYFEKRIWFNLIRENNSN